MSDFSHRDPRIHGILKFAEARRKIDHDQLRAWNAAGYTDKAVAELCGCSFSAAHYARKILGLPINREGKRPNKGRRTREQNRQAEADATCRQFNLPPLAPMELRIVLALAAGGESRYRLGQKLGYVSYRGTRLSRMLPDLTRRGILTRTDYPKNHDTKASTWRLTEETVAATFRRDRIGPLQQHLVTTHIDAPRIASLRYFYASRFPTYRDDVISAVGVGLITAALRYDPTKAAFMTFMVYQARNAIIDELRRVAPSGLRRRKYQSDQKPVKVIPATGGISGDDSFDPLNQIEGRELPPDVTLTATDAFEQLIQNLNDRDRMLFRLRYVEDLSLDDVAARSGLSHDAVVHRLSDARAIMRKNVAHLLDSDSNPL